MKCEARLYQCVQYNLYISVYHFPLCYIIVLQFWYYPSNTTIIIYWCLQKIIIAYRKSINVILLTSLRKV
jgi:hypothetical protein